jgi:hypothetical protein
MVMIVIIVIYIYNNNNNIIDKKLSLLWVYNFNYVCFDATLTFEDHKA